MRVASGVLIVGLAGILTVWVVAANLGRDWSGGRASAPTATRIPPAPEPDQVDRLGARLATMPAPPTASRNPFRFAGEEASRPGDAAVTLRAGDGPLATDADLERPPRPPLRLLGIAEDKAQPGTVARTAILSAGDRLYLVRDGEQVALRFLVTGVESDAIELRDLVDDSIVRVTLR